MPRIAKWPAEDLAILVSKYGTYGVNIPELLSKYTTSAIKSQARRQSVTLNEYRTEWTLEEDAILQSKYPHQGSNIPELLTNRTAKAIVVRAKVLKVQYLDASKPWTENDFEVLNKLYPEKGPDIPELLERHSLNSIKSKARALQLQIEGSVWTEQEVKALQEEFPIYGAEAPSLKGKRTADAIRAKARVLGIKVDKAAQALWTETDISLLKKWYPTKGTEIPELSSKFTAKQIRGRACYLGIHREDEGARARWTETEDEILRREFPTKGADIPELLKAHSEVSIGHRAQRLGLTTSRIIWTEEDIKILKEEYPTCGPDIDAFKDRFTRKQICKKANSLQLRIEGHNVPWTPEEEAIIEAHYETCSANDLAKLLPGRNASSIYAYVNKRRRIKMTLQSTTWRNPHITMSAAAYTGTDGVEYVFVKCHICNKVLLVSKAEVNAFTHGDLCESHCVPEGIRLPQKF